MEIDHTPEVVWDFQPGFVVAVLLVLALGGWCVARAWRGSWRDMPWFAPAGASPAELSLYRAYLRRHRRWRVTGAVAGAVLATIVGLSGDGTVFAGLAPNPATNALVAGILGCVVGALGAESYRIRGVRGPVAVSIAARPAERLQPAARASWLVGAIGLAVALAAAVQRAPGWHLAVANAAVGAGILALAWWTSRAIDRRPRPALSAGAARADERLRTFGRVRIGWLGLAGTTLMLGCVLVSLAPPETLARNEDGVRPDAPVAAVILGLGALTVSLWALHRASPYPPLTFRPPRPAPRPSVIELLDRSDAIGRPDATGSSGKPDRQASA